MHPDCRMNDVGQGAASGEDARQTRHRLGARADMVGSSAVGRPAGKRPRGVVSAFFACKKRRTPAFSNLRGTRLLWFCGGPLTRGRLLFRVAFSSIGCFGRPHLMRGRAAGQPIVHLRTSVLRAAWSTRRSRPGRRGAQPHDPDRQTGLSSVGLKCIGLAFLTQPAFIHRSAQKHG